jgi:hypothetical protein
MLSGITAWTHRRNRAGALPEEHLRWRLRAPQPPWPPGCAVCATLSRGRPLARSRAAASSRPAQRADDTRGCCNARNPAKCSCMDHAEGNTGLSCVAGPSKAVAGAHGQRQGAEGVAIVADAALRGGCQQEAHGRLEVAQRHILYHSPLLPGSAVPSLSLVSRTAIPSGGLSSTGQGKQRPACPALNDAEPVRHVLQARLGINSKAIGRRHGRRSTTGFVPAAPQSSRCCAET